MDSGNKKIIVFIIAGIASEWKRLIKKGENHNKKQSSKQIDNCTRKTTYQ